MAGRNAEIEEAFKIERALKPYLLSSVKTLASGGFHTPNHRWVIMSAMAQVKELYPELEVENAINDYLFETIDINKDGFYSEKSTGIYNAVVNRQLIFAAESLGLEELLEPVRRNLHCMIDLMHDDWTVLTSISIRQDRGKSTVPLALADSLYYIARLDRYKRLSAAVRALLKLGGNKNTFLVYMFVRHPEWYESELSKGSISTNFIKHMPDLGIWRVRRNKLSATLITENVTPFSLKYGEVELKGMQIHMPYFSGAEYKGQRLTTKRNEARLLMKSEFNESQP